MLVMHGGRETIDPSSDRNTMDAYILKHLGAVRQPLSQVELDFSFSPIVNKVLH